jgi:SAM-dependent methyltransferase
MLDRARALQREKGLANVSWHAGDVRRLPFPDGSFSIVTVRYAFHHLEEPARALREMARVAKRGGRICVADVAAPDVASKAEAFNRMERLRDPSHVRALSLAELRGLFAAQSLVVQRESFYRLEFEVEALIAGSFPAGGDRERLREVYHASVADDARGMTTGWKDGKLVCSYPIAVMVAEY